MRKIENLNEVLDKHNLWINGLPGGERANLSGADLSHADLCGANLSGAYLRYANLRRAYLSDAYLSDANLSGANLSDANLSDANLRDVNLRRAYLSDADLRVANLSGADLSDANLRDANLRYANLNGANLSDADLCGALFLSSAVYYPLQCPERGSFIGYKKAENHIVVLEICDDALRSSATSRKCRCSKARVISIENLNGDAASVKTVHSDRDENFFYTIGETVCVDNFDTCRWNECAPGIHFFITKEEAVYYNG